MALIVKIGANMNQFDKQMKKLTKDVKTVGNKLKGAGMALTASVTLPIMAIGTAAAKVGMDFEAGMSKVAAISGATGDDLAALEAKAREMGATTKFSATESAEALSYMAMAGWDTEQMLGGIEGVMSLAAASGEDLATVSDIVTDALTAFGMSADDSGRFADVLATAASNANTNVSMLGESFKMVAPVAGALGFSVEDTTKALALMANSGIKGSEAGTALRTMMTNLASPTKAMQGAMDELGISLTNSDGSMKTLDEVMQNLRTSFDGLDESQQAAYAATIFGKEAMSGALSVINASEEDYNKLSDSITNSEGSAENMAKTMGDNLAGRLKEMKSAFEEVAIVIFDRLQPALEKIVGIAKGVADWFNNLSPSTQNLVIGLAALAAAIGPILMVVGMSIILFGQLSAALTVLKISMMTAFWWVLAIIAALAAIIAIVVYWDEIKAYFIKFWEATKKVFSQAWDAIKNKTTEICGKISSYLSGIWESIKNTTSSIWESIKTFFKDHWDKILTIFMGPIGFLVGFIIKNWEGIKSSVTNIWESIKSTASKVWNAMKDTIVNPVLRIKDGVVSAFNGMKDTALSAWEGLKSGMRTAINGILKLINKFINGFNSPAKLLNKIPGVDVPTIPTIPMLAKGGNLYGNGTAIVGEAGPELVQKSGSSVKVTPLSAREKAGGFTSALGINRPVELVVNLDSVEIAKATYPHIDDISMFNSLRTRRFGGDPLG